MMVVGVAYHNQQNLLLSSSMDMTVRLWHVCLDDCLCTFQHHDFVTVIAFNPLVCRVVYRCVY